MIVGADGRTGGIVSMRNMHRRAVVSVLVMVGGTALMGCCDSKQAGRDAELAVQQFHTRYNAADYRGIYADATDNFKRASTEGDFVALLEGVRRKLGEHRTSTPGPYRLMTGTHGVTYTQSLQSEFVEGKGTETFVWHIADSRARLVGYNINSPVLVIK
jgi:hypothetical protein